MTTISEYLTDVRKARGHNTVTKLAYYARTRGHSLTAQAIRNFEQGKIPNAESREILADVLHLSAESRQLMEVLCARADVERRWSHLDLFVVDPIYRKSVARDLARVALPDDANRAQISEAAARIETCLKKPDSQA